MSLLIKRVTKEIKKLDTEKIPYGIEVIPNNDNIYEWDAKITGGKDTPHDGLTYNLKVRIGEDYPRKPPQIFFTSKIFHPNVYRDGKICIDILQNQWAPTMRIITALVSIQSLLDDPNPNSPANVDAAKVYRTSMKQYKEEILKAYAFNNK